MSRSIKKGPYVNFKLERKVEKMNEGGKKVEDLVSPQHDHS